MARASAASVAFTNWAQPLLADFTIVDRIPEPDIITDAPTLLRLPTGRLLCAFPRVSAVRVAHPRGPPGGHHGAGGHEHARRLLER